MTADTLTKDESIRLMQAEIERLREENSTFSDSLAAKADRIDRLGETVARQVAEIERLRQQVTQRGARMQVMREWMGFCPSGPTQNLWADFTYDRPEAVSWFDEDGAPR